MTSEYDDITAFHYASYRPPLHIKILAKCLGDESYQTGLDIGCGTGQSSIALSNFCNRVFGVDPSADMLSKGMIHPKVSYSQFDKTQIDFKDDRFDIITLAGSLWYAKSQKLLDEIVRVGEKNSRVLVYDFQVLLDSILAKLGFEKQEDANSYNLQENFSGLDTSKIEELSYGRDRIRFQMSAKELTHIVLSVKDRYEFFKDLYGFQEMFDTMVEKIASNSKSKRIDIEADTFFTQYQVK